MQESEQIYTQYRQDVYRYLCSLTRDAALAEDLLSETFLRALTGLSGFRKGACVRTWLFSIARHVWIDGLRRKRHVLSGDELLARYVEEGGPGAPPFETQVDARALAARAKELLQTRRPPAGEVLWLRAQGYSFAEIAQRCGVSESAARTLDFRTRHWLREQLQKEGAEL